MNFTSKSVFTIVCKFGGAILSIFISVFLARLLGVSGVGKYQLLLSTQVITTNLLAMGFGTASIYFINKLNYDKSYIISNTLKFFHKIAILYIVIFFIILQLFPSYFGNYNKLSLLVFCLGSGTLFLFSLMLPILYSSLEVVKIQFLSLLSSFLLIVGSLIFYFTSYTMNINNVIFLYGVSNIISFIFLCFFLRNDISFKVSIDYLLMKRMFIYGIKLSSTNFVFLLTSNLIVFLLKYFLVDGFESIGLFSRSLAIINIFVLVPSSIGPLIYSKWASLESACLKEEVERVLRVLLFISYAGVVSIILLGKKAIVFLYGIEFIAASNSLYILSFSVIFSTIVTIAINIFASIGKPTITLMVFVNSLIITGLTGIFFISKFDIQGAAISVALGGGYNACHLLYLAKKEINISIANCLFISKADVRYLLKTLKIIRNNV